LARSPHVAGTPALFNSIAMFKPEQKKRRILKKEFAVEIKQ